MRLLWLPDVLRAAGLTVHGVDGWRERGADGYGPVRGITCHHTAGSRTSTDKGELNTLVHGRGKPGDANYLPGPISQLYLSRSGEWWVVASGTANHNLVGWAGPNKGFGNDSLLGIEAQHSGGGEPWTDRQYRSYVRGVAALVAHKAPGYSVSVARVAGHKEHQPGAKTDPTFDMDRFRADVDATIREGDDVSARDVWTTDGLVDAPAGRVDKSNEHFTPAGMLTWIANWTFEGAARSGRAVETAAQTRATLEAILAAVQGSSSAEILARINEVAAAEQQRDTDLRTLVEQGLSGEVDAAEVVRLIGERLTT